MMEEFAGEVVVTEADQPGAAAPQTDHHARRAGVHKAPRQTHQPFTFDLLAQSGFTHSKGHDFRLQIQGINYMRAQKSRLGRPDTYFKTFAIYDGSPPPYFK